MLTGYARVSITEQSLNLQTDALVVCRLDQFGRSLKDLVTHDECWRTPVERSCPAP